MEPNPEKKKLLEYAQQHPEYYPIMQSGVFIKIIKALEKEAKNIEDICEMFSSIDKEDFKEIINTLIKVGLVSKLTFSEKILYYTNENGTEFLKYCNLAKNAFDVTDGQ